MTLTETTTLSTIYEEARHQADNLTLQIGRLRSTRANCEAEAEKLRTRLDELAELIAQYEREERAFRRALGISMGTLQAAERELNGVLIEQVTP